MSAPAPVWVQGIGLLGPGLASWTEARALLQRIDAGDDWQPTPAALPAPLRLPPAERRRAGAAVKLAMAVADEAVTQARVDPAGLATVFASSSGEGLNCHSLCESLAAPVPVISPTRFTNSVHNAASGSWHIAVGSRAASTSLCAFDASFGAGLIEACTAVTLSRQPVLLVASDSPYPEPLNSTRPLPDHFGISLLLSPTPGASAIASLGLSLTDGSAPASRCSLAALEQLRHSIPAAAGLALLQALARGGSQRVNIAYLAGCGIAIDVVTP